MYGGALLALEDAEKSIGHAPSEMVLYHYETEAEFVKSGGVQRYGCDWRTHNELLVRVANRLTADGYSARLEYFKDEPSEPSNIHEPTAEERGWDSEG